MPASEGKVSSCRRAVGRIRKGVGMPWMLFLLQRYSSYIKENLYLQITRSSCKENPIHSMTTPKVHAPNAWTNM